MRIYIEETQLTDDPKLSKEDSHKTPARNIVNIFDIKAIVSEISEYGIVVEVIPRLEKLSDTLFAIRIRAPYQGNNGLMGNDSKDAADVALIVDYSNDTAIAMSRHGSDKEKMILISSIANKHINEPFKYDKSIRSKL